MIEILDTPESTYIDTYIDVIARSEQGMIYNDTYDEVDEFTCMFYDLTKEQATEILKLVDTYLAWRQ